MTPRACDITQIEGVFGCCDECVVDGQNVFLGPTIHLPRLED